MSLNVSGLLHETALVGVLYQEKGGGLLTFVIHQKCFTVTHSLRCKDFVLVATILVGDVVVQLASLNN